MNYSFEGEEILFILLRVVSSALSTVNDISWVNGTQQIPFGCMNEWKNEHGVSGRKLGV